MGSKFGTIISLIFVMMFIILGSDIMSIQFIYSDLDAKAVNISYLISKNGVSNSMISSIEQHYQVSFLCLSNCNSEVGDVVEFQISKQYKPIVLSNEPLTLYVNRQAIIGYYG